MTHGANARIDEEIIMTEVESGFPDATRRQLLRSVFEPSSLIEVAEALSVATEREHSFYVERLNNRWRWSFVHRGGAYPLLRVTARFLKCDHYRIMIGFRTLPSGLSILCEDPGKVTEPEAWAIIAVSKPTSTPAVLSRILDRLG
jgi:hypothetical protein